MQNKQKWYKFEQIAVKYLESLWYEILDKNFTIKWWEIDIIATKDKVVSFVEVKWASTDIDFQDYITKWKIKALQRTAQHWIYKNDKEDIQEYRFDLLLIKNWKIVDFIENFLD
jgi:putative endonuclease